jgi:hypothetical protein
MTDIPIYSTLDEKKEYFNKENTFFIIDTKDQLDRWFQYHSLLSKKGSPVDFIFRGMTEAKYKLFTSAQRFWITDNMDQWKAGYTHKSFIEQLVEHAKKSTLLKKIFDLYGYTPNERDFPILSLLQHYGAPSPLLDWTYNLSNAVFFAVDGIKRSDNNKSDIDNYLSIYSINKRKYAREITSLYDISGEHYPTIISFRNFGDENNKNANILFILSDFEKSTKDAYTGALKVVDGKPITSLYNQNIIAQEGLLMYNPFRDRPVEQLFNVNYEQDGQNLHLEPFDCFNIHKDLAEYLRRLIASNHGIQKNFIYPHLYDDASRIKEQVMNEIVRLTDGYS